MLVSGRTGNKHKLSDSKSHATCKDMAESLINGSEEVMMNSHGDIALIGVFFGLIISKELVLVNLCLIVESITKTIYVQASAMSHKPYL